jgi:RND family efflux transporter MFP subunit
VKLLERIPARLIPRSWNPRDWVPNGWDPKVVLPIGALAVGALGAAILMVTSSPVAGRPSERMVRAVRVVPVKVRSVELSVQSQGTVAPRTESELIPEVSGRVVWTSPELVSGGFFEKDEPLLRIDETDYATAVARARASLSRAQGEHGHARDVLKRQRDLKERNVVSEAALDDAERTAQVASASLREARLALEQAERDLTRTEIAAPFTGRVREKRVDVGQFLNRGQSFGTIYATDFVEVRLPIADAQLAYLNLALWTREVVAEDQLPLVTLSARFAGEAREWTGRILRTEGEIDPKSRLVHVVARVQNDPDARMPLPVGLFVQARIAGRRAEQVAVVPRQALQGESRVLIVDAANRLRFREVEVLRLHGDNAFISKGLQDGERVCISALQAPVDGMTVRPVAVDAAEVPES